MKLPMDRAREIAKVLKFKDGLITAIARDFRSKDVLMVANMNEEALLKTLTTGLMHYWSRSRKRLWLKGETSGHYQRVREVWVDCDGDAAVFDVEQVGGACHEGYYSCFYRKLRRGKLVTALKRKFDPKKVYG
ncbi:MAG: phosphoribosyl-AMP cyclohydrolase [Candidatus Hadarchaeales archaeon]